MKYSEKSLKGETPWILGNVSEGKIFLILLALWVSWQQNPTTAKSRRGHHWGTACLGSTQEVPVFSSELFLSGSQVDLGQWAHTASAALSGACPSAVSANIYSCASLHKAVKEALGFPRNFQLAIALTCLLSFFLSKSHLISWSFGSLFLHDL